MSMSVRDEETGLEWAGALGAARAVPDSRPTCRDRRYLRMLTEIPRFHRRRASCCLAEARPTADDARRPCGAVPARAAASRRTSSRHFMSRWSRPCGRATPSIALDYPARYLFTFLDHHGMLRSSARRTWRTVTGGSRAYVERVGRRTCTTVRTASPVASVREHRRRRRGDRPRPATAHVRRRGGRHPPRPGAGAAGRARPPLQREVLGALRYSPNTALLHTDDRAAAAAPRAPGPRGTTAGRRPRRGRVLGHLRHDPAAAAAPTDDPLPGHPRRRATSSTPTTVIARR